MRKGQKVTLVRPNPRWAELKAQDPKFRFPKVGTEGKVLGTQQGTGVLLVKFRGRAWPLACDPQEVEAVQPA